jgi:hypothetical protein
MTKSLALPAFAEKIRRLYVGGESSMFLLYLNVFDRVLHGEEQHSLTDFLARVLLWDNKDNIIVYDPAAGISLLKKTAELERIEELRVHRSPRELLPLLEAVLFSTNSTALIVTYAGVLVPAGELHLLTEQDRLNMVRFHRWSLSPALREKDNVVFLLTESLPEINAQLVGNPVISAVEVPMPNEKERARVIERAAGLLHL